MQRFMQNSGATPLNCRAQKQGMMGLQIYLTTIRFDPENILTISNIRSHQAATCALTTTSSPQTNKGLHEPAGRLTLDWW